MSEKVKGGLKNMKFNFKKVTSVVASAAMIGSTLGIAAAAAYPTPFVSGGVGNTAVVVGSNAASSDMTAALDIGANLAAAGLVPSSGSGSTTTTLTGENAALFGASKLYYNSTLNSIKSIVTKSDMPNTLADQSFSGNVDATVSHSVTLGSDPRVKYERQPTSSDDPTYALVMSTSTNNPLYNATVNFNKAINFTHADSKGQEITLFGQTFTVGSETDTTSLVLLKSSKTVSLSSDQNPSQSVEVAGKTYTIELVWTSSTAARVRVVDSSGNSNEQTIDIGRSKKVSGISVAVNSANNDAALSRATAQVIVGADKMALTSGSSVTVGEDETVIDGTKATITGGTGAATSLTLSVAAPNSDVDSIAPGEEFVDPVFGTFAVSFTGITNNADSDRETISVNNLGDDRMEVRLTDVGGTEKAIQWAYNHSGSVYLQRDSDGRNISIAEGEAVRRGEYLVVGDKNRGRLLELTRVANETTGFANDRVTFRDVFDSSEFSATITAEGVGSISVDGKVHTLTYSGANSESEDDRTVRLNSPDSAANKQILFPTVMTSKGAKFAFYEPQTVNVGNWDGSGAALTGFELPNGDGYTAVTAAVSTDPAGNVTIGGTLIGNGTSSTTASVGQLTYNFTATGVANQTRVYLVDPTGGNIESPALVLIQEKDDDNNYESVVITNAVASNKIGVGNIRQSGSASGQQNLASDSKISSGVNLWGTVTTLDSTSSDQKTATISYPDEQVYAELYLAAADAMSDGGDDGDDSAGSTLVVKDNEADKISNKHLVVVGGSCINTIAAQYLGGSFCAADFTEETGVGAGEYLIETFERTGGKIATVVAGYNAADTTNAAAALITEKPEIAVGKKFKGSASGLEEVA